MKILTIPLLALLTALSGSGGRLTAAETPEAKTFDPAIVPMERYRHLWEKSPFVTETPAAPKTGGLAQRYVLAGIASLQNEPVVFVLDRQSLARLVVTRDPNPDGLSLISLMDESDPKQASATVRLGSEKGVIRYDPAALEGIHQGQVSEPQSTNAQTPAPNTSAQATPEGKTPPPRGKRVIIRKKRINLSH